VFTSATPQRDLDNELLAVLEVILARVVPGGVRSLERIAERSTDPGRQLLKPKIAGVLDTPSSSHVVPPAPQPQTSVVAWIWSVIRETRPSLGAGTFYGVDAVGEIGPVAYDEKCHRHAIDGFAKWRVIRVGPRRRVRQSRHDSLRLETRKRCQLC